MNNSDFDQTPYCYYYFEKKYIIYLSGFAAAVASLFGFLTNIISVVIFLHKTLRSYAVSWYLLFRSISDIVLMLTVFFMTFLKLIAEHFRCFSVVNATILASPVLYGISGIGLTASSFLTLAVTAHNFIAQCQPQRSQSILTNTRSAVTVSTIVLLLSVVINILRFLEVGVSEECFSKEINHSVYRLQPTNFGMFLQTSHFGVLAYKLILTNFIILLLPFIAIIIMNIKVKTSLSSCKMLQKSKVVHAANLLNRSRQQHMHAPDYPKIRAEIATNVAESMMVLTVGLVYVACNTPETLLHVLGELTAIQYAFYDNWLYQTVTLLWLVPPCCAIFVYLIFSQKYRTLAKGLFGMKISGSE